MSDHPDDPEHDPDESPENGGPLPDIPDVAPARAREAVAGEPFEPPPSAKKGITDEEVAEALRRTGGLVSHAAEQLGITRQTLHERIKGKPWLEELKADRFGHLLDVAESTVYKGVLEADWDRTRFFLENRGHERGYGAKRYELTGKDGAPLNADRFGTWLAGLTHEQQQAFAAITGGAGIRQVGRLGDEEPAPRPADGHEGDADLGEAV